MLLLAWLYVTGLAFLIGGEINAEIERAATGGPSERAVPRQNVVHLQNE
jgi:uncharacterized BrkB/YihY/UPF0761 family membrane protein